MEDAPGLSDEERGSIARRLILQSPPGELMQVANDVRTLLGNDDIINAMALDVFREYNTDQMIAVNLPEASGQCLVTTAGAVSGEEYLDPRTAQVITVNHIKQRCVGIRPATEEENTPASLQGYRASLDDALESHVSDAFPDARYAVYAAEPAGVKTLTACVSSAKFNAANFWNGRWRSVWTATLSEDQTTWAVAGTFKVDLHYFEEGNVQMNAAGEHAAQLPVDGQAADAAALVEIIRKAEHAYMVTLEDTYSNMSEGPFKELRRTLPLTRMKFNWANASHSLAAELRRNS